jgi:putative ABC transport system permease protein
VIGAIRLLNLRRIRRQPMRAVLAIVAVAAGVALAVSVLVVSGSVKRSWARYGQSLGGVQGLRIVGAATRGGLEPAMVERVAAVPGVGAAVPMVQAVALIDLTGPPPAGASPAGHPTAVVALGVDCRIENLLGPVGCSPQAIAATPPASPPLISRSLARRATPAADVRTDVGRLPLVGPAPAIAQLDRLNQGRVLLFPLPQAQTLFARSGTIDVIYVLPKPGVPLADLRARLTDAVGPANGVLAAGAPPVGASIAILTFLLLFGILSLFALGIGGVLIYNTINLSLEERRHDLAVVAALGGSPAMLRGGVLAEAGTLGLIGGLLGIGGGVLVARPITASLSGLTRSATGLTATAHITARPVVYGLMLGVLIALVASWRPARRAIRPDVAADLAGRDRRVETASSLRYRRALGYGGLGAMGVLMTYLGQRDGALEPWQPVAAQVGMLAAILGFILAAGALAPILAHNAQWAVRRAAGPVRLGVANLSREGSRTSVMAVAVSATVGTAVVIASFTLAIRSGILSSADRGAGGRIHASTMPVNNSFQVDARPSPDVIGALARLPSVASVDRFYVVLAGHRDRDLVGVEALDHNTYPFHVFTGKVDRAAIDAGGVMVGAGLARDRHLRGGSSVRLPTLHGLVDLKVLGVWDYGDFNGRNVVMAPGLLNQLWGPQPPTDLFIRPAPGVSQAQLVAAVRDAHLDPYLSTQTPVSVAHDVIKALSAQMAPFWVMQRTLLLVAFIAVLSTLLLIGLQRRRELGLLAAVGMAPAELGSMVMTEGTSVGVIGTILGTAAGIAMFEAMREDLPLLLGFHNPFRIDGAAVGLYGVIAIAVVVLAAAWPAWRTSRMETAAALQYE